MGGSARLGFIKPAVVVASLISSRYREAESKIAAALAYEDRAMMSEVNDVIDLETDCQQLAHQAKRASRPLAIASGAAKNAWLLRAARSIDASSEEILASNDRDVAAAPGHGLNAAGIDRLTLNTQRLAAIAQSLRDVAALPDPIGEVVTSSRRPNGLDVKQIRVPLGVIFMIFESRPNVTVDAAALCVKSGNAVILRGGKESINSNRALARVLIDALEPSGLPVGSVQLVATTDRAAVGHLLSLPNQIDLAIPRGGESLIRRVVAEAKMPVLKHYDGVCHLFIDESADLDMATAILLNSKVQRPGVCNALETILIHRGIAESYLPQLGRHLADQHVEIRGDDGTLVLIPSATRASAMDWDTEYLDLIVSIRVVDDLDSALEHIARHGSKHTDAIVTNRLDIANRFVNEVDSAAVVVNASTRFNDGGQLGLGAEIGISTDKFHARGPCGLRELTTSKWVIQGNGQIRE